MPRLFFCFTYVFLLAVTLQGQQHSVGFGLHSGFTIPVTLDEGMDKDSRYDARYSIKGAPIGFTFMKDYEGFGFVLSPGLVNIGQNYDMVNIYGGHEGKRNITLRYFSLPIAFKLHLINLDFFRVSGLVAVSGAYMYEAEDRLSHDDTKFLFPLATHPILPEGYLVEYDGVMTPVVNNRRNAEIKDFNKTQIFAGVGLRSDWDINNSWRVSIDFRVNYGLMESRTKEYRETVDKFENIYDMPGSRKDLFAHMSFGIARYFDFDKNDKDREKRLNGKKKFTPQKQSRSRLRSGRR